MKNLLLAMLVVAVAAIATEWDCARAQERLDYPSKSIRLMTPEVPGSATDILARILAPKLGEALGQEVTIENRLGAAGIEAGAKAAPDGYTLTYGSAGTLALLPHIDKTIRFNSFKDFAPVSLYAINPTLLAVHPSLPVADVKGLVALMKAKPHQLKMAT